MKRSTVSFAALVTGVGLAATAAQAKASSIFLDDNKVVDNGNTDKLPYDVLTTASGFCNSDKLRFWFVDGQFVYSRDQDGGDVHQHFGNQLAIQCGQGEGTSACPKARPTSGCPVASRAPAMSLSSLVRQLPPAPAACRKPARKRNPTE